MDYFLWTLFMLIFLIGIYGICVFLYKRIFGKKNQNAEMCVCPKCGEKLSDDSAFCEHCGEPIKQNRKYSIRRTDIRWILLVAMAIATLALLISFDAKDIYLYDLWRVSKFAFLPSLFLAIVAVIYGSRNLLPWSFVILMAVFAFMNAGMYVSAVDGGIRKTEYQTYVNIDIQSSDDSLSSANLFMAPWRTSLGFDSEILGAECEKLKEYAEVLAESLRKQGDEVSVNCDYREYHYYPNSNFIRWLVAEGFLLILYLIYALFAYRKKWTF